MEKKIPHCQLSAVKALVAAGQVRSTSSALAGAAALDMGFEEMIGTVMALTAQDFQKA